jgi:hypothetical protein
LSFGWLPTDLGLDSITGFKIFIGLGRNSEFILPKKKKFGPDIVIQKSLKKYLIYVLIFIKPLSHMPYYVILLIKSAILNQIADNCMFGIAFLQN